MLSKHTAWEASLRGMKRPIALEYLQDFTLVLVLVSGYLVLDFLLVYCFYFPRLLRFLLVGT